MKRKINKSKGITLVALVVTIVVLLILAGITMMYVMGDNSVFKQASNAKEQTEIAKYKEMLETAKSSIIVEGQGTFNPEKYFEKIEDQGIIESKDGSVTNNEDNTYDVNTKPGYVFLVTLKPDKENPRDAKIEYLGKAGKILPIIKKIEVNATETSITGKAIVSRLGENGTIEYYCGLSTVDEKDYSKMTFISNEEGASIALTLEEGKTYRVKIVAKNDAGESTDYIEVTIGVKVKSITLNQTKTTIAPKETLQLIPTVLPEDAENKKIIWSSNKPEIATVDENGLVTAIAIGDAVITATTKDGSSVTATCNVSVKIPVTGISLNEISARVEMGKTITLIANIEPNDATNNEVIWSSSDTTIATVSSTGVVKGETEGTVTITATSLDNKTIKKTCSVKVTEESDWPAIAEAAKQIANDQDVKNTTTQVTKNGVLLKVGEIYKIKYNGEIKKVKLMEFKRDDLVNKNAYGGEHNKASLTFGFFDSVGEEKMSSSSTISGGWAGSVIRRTLNGYSSSAQIQSSSIGGIARTLASNMGNTKYIKQVKKNYISDYKLNVCDDTPCYDFLWLFSLGEMNGTSPYRSNTIDGPRYLYYANGGRRPEVLMWTRTASDTNTSMICYMNASSDAPKYSATSVINMLPGFCI